MALSRSLTDYDNVLQSGIGNALTRDLLKQGWRVAGFDIQDSVGEELQEELGESFFYLHCDVADYDQQAAAFTKVFDRWGQIDALCNNAGLIDKTSIYQFKHRGKTELVMLSFAVGQV